MLSALAPRQARSEKEQLLELYWNRAGVKRELKNLKTERYELLDKLKEQEGAIVRAQEQLEGLERLLTNPLAAANAMVYFQLRHMWRVAALRLEQFGAELHTQRQKRERAQLQGAALAKRNRRLAAVKEKLGEVMQRRSKVIEEGRRLDERLERMNALLRLIKGPRLKRRLQRVRAARETLEQRVEEFNELQEKIEGEPLPEPQGLSLESRRLINAALIAFAQHLAAHFSENDLTSLARTSTERPVADMSFGDRRACDRMVECVRERVEELKNDKSLAERVKRRSDRLLPELSYDNESDSVPTAQSVAKIAPLDSENELGLARRASDAPLAINVLSDNYWDLRSALR